nr:unnamed protein product [Spirometra erinaceieuropaei]
MKTAVDWYGIWRDVCTKALLQEVGQLGGPDIEVQVDETMISRRKYNVGRLKKQNWIMVKERNIPLSGCRRSFATPLHPVTSGRRDLAPHLGFL